MKKEDIAYIRCGTTYYKKSLLPTSSGDGIEILLPWRKETIKQDEGRDFLAEIPKYDGFVCIPSHIDYQREYQNYYNTYHPLYCCPVKGHFNKTLAFLKHLFGEQLEYGLDYLQLLYVRPAQVLPILCLVSKERATGKSTFLKWLNLVFEKNLTYITNQNFSSQFNSDWANKLLICVDEVLFQKDELTERIKYLSTTNINKLEAKGRDRIEVEFFGKFILCSNNETNFIKIDADEIRFWVRKIPKIKQEDTNLLFKMKNEIPAFLFFLQHREMKVKKALTRMWFSASQIRTKALERLVAYNGNKTEIHLVEVLHDIFEEVAEDQILLCPLDLQSLSSKLINKHIVASEIRKILKQWQCEQATNSMSYLTYVFREDGCLRIKKRGRYYSVKKLFIQQKYDALMQD